MRSSLGNLPIKVISTLLFTIRNYYLPMYLLLGVEEGVWSRSRLLATYLTVHINFANCEFTAFLISLEAVITRYNAAFCTPQGLQAYFFTAFLNEAVQVHICTHDVSGDFAMHSMQADE